MKPLSMTYVAYIGTIWIQRNEESTNSFHEMFIKRGTCDYPHLIAFSIFCQPKISRYQARMAFIAVQKSAVKTLVRKMGCFSLSESKAPIFPKILGSSLSECFLSRFSSLRIQILGRLQFLRILRFLNWPFLTFKWQNFEWSYEIIFKGSLYLSTAMYRN